MRNIFIFRVALIQQIEKIGIYMQEFNENIGERLIKVLDEKRLNQQDLAQMINVEQPTISRICNNATKKSKYLPEIAKALKVDLNWLMTGQKSEQSHLELKNKQLRINQNEFMLISIYQDENTKVFQESENSKKEENQLMLDKSIVPVGKTANDIEYFIANDTAMGVIIGNNARVTFDKSNTLITSGKMYAVQHGSLTEGRYLYLLPNGKIRIRAFNSDEYPDVIIDLEDQKFKVLGKILTITNVIE